MKTKTCFFMLLLLLMPLLGFAEKKDGVQVFPAKPPEARVIGEVKAKGHSESAALNHLKDKAVDQGANALVDVTYRTTGISTGKPAVDFMNRRIEVSGTAILVK